MVTHVSVTPSVVQKTLKMMRYVVAQVYTLCFFLGENIEIFII